MFGKHGRAAAAFASGAITYLAVLYRGLSYTSRSQLSGASYLVFAGLLLALGFALTLRMQRARYRIASWMLLGVFAGHLAIVEWDWRSDPTDHNLLPFEFLILGVLGLAGYIGIALAHAAGRWMK